ncbi:MAG: serine protease [Mariniblastus sp.]|nr:serine protease [Mariniblastus sp.]
MTRVTAFLFAAIMLVTTSVHLEAQVGRESGLWNWTDKAPHHQSIVQVTAGEGTGTGVIIGVDRSKEVKDGYEGYCLTAWHVVQHHLNSNEISITYGNGRRAKKCKILESDQARDIAIIWVWVPRGVPAAKIANRSIKGGDELEFCGLGGGSDVCSSVRHFAGTASSPSTLDRIFADVPLLPGDSGGPVFNAKQEVVGIISGGWFWYDGGITTSSGAAIRTTWPARASNVHPIRTLMGKIDSGEVKKF